jgi:hypothetical protein
MGRVRVLVPLLCVAVGAALVHASPAIADADGSGSSDPAGFSAVDPVRVVDTRTSDRVGAQGVVVVDEPAVDASNDAATNEETITVLPGARLLDTRGPGTVDGLSSGGGAIPDRGVIFIPVAGRGGVPTDAHSAMLSLVAVGASGEGHATLWPCESVNEPVPNSSVLNFNSGWVRANGVMVALGDTGGVCLYVLRSTHAVIDVQAYSTSTNLVTITPTRIVDSRAAGNSVFVDEEVRRYDISSRVGDAPAAYLNITSVGNTEGGFATVWPCESVTDPMPDSSVLNHVPYHAVANNTLTGLVDGGFCVYSYRETHIIVDLMGYLTQGAVDVDTITPYRIVDTRSYDETYPSSYGSDRAYRVLAGETRMIHIAGADVLSGRPSIANDVTAITANFTAVSPLQSAFLTVWPCESPTDTVPNTSMLNYDIGWAATPNNSVQKLSSTGALCVYSYEATHIIIDISAVFIDMSPPEVHSSAVGALLPAYEFHFYTCDHPTDTESNPFWNDPANTSAESVVAAINDPAYDATSDLEKLFLGSSTATFHVGGHLGDCADDRMGTILDDNEEASADNRINVLQFTSPHPEVSWAGMAVYGAHFVWMNHALSVNDQWNWSGVFAHEVGHTMMSWGHSGYGTHRPYSSSYDLMSSGSSGRFAAHRYLATGAATPENYSVYDGTETSYTLTVNPSDSGNAPTSGETIGVFVPASTDVSHPGFFADLPLALSIEGMTRGNSELDDCDDGAWNCSALVVHTVNYQPARNNIGVISDTQTIADISSDPLGRQVVIGIGQTLNVAGVNITLNSIENKGSTFNITISGEFTKNFDGDGYYLDVTSSTSNTDATANSLSRRAERENGRNPLKEYLVARDNGEDIPDELDFFGDSDHDHDDHCGCNHCC